MKKRPKKKPHLTYPTVTEQSEIDELATGLVKQWFSSGWKLRPQIPDYYVDYAVERVEAGEMTGKIVCVQQKAHRRVPFSNGFASEQIKIEHLQYYAEKSDRPVFLILVDNTAQVGYYLFLQEWIDQQRPKLNLTGAGTKSVRVPAVNRIDDVPSFLVAVQRSLIYVREKHPGSVPAAIRMEEKRVAAIDPRFAVSLDVIGGQHFYRLNATEEFSVSIKVKGEAVKLFKELYDYGRPLNISVDDIEIEGLPLFDAWTKAKGTPRLAVGERQGFPVTWQLWSTSPGEHLHLTLDGAFTRGAAGMLFTGKLKDGPMRVEMKFPPAGSPSSGLTSAKFAWDFSCWHGRPIDDLPHFEDLHHFARLLSEGRTFSHVFNHDGRKFFPGTLDFTKGAIQFASSEFDVIEIARVAAEKFGIHPLLPVLSKLTVDDLSMLQMIRDLAVDGFHEQTGRDLALPGMFAGIKEPKAILAMLDSQLPRPHDDERPNQRGSIFGTTAELGTLQFYLNPAIIVVSADVRAALDAGKTEPMPMQVVGIGDATLRIRRVANPADCAKLQ